MNPYQALTYRRFAEEGIAAAPILKPADFRDLRHIAPLASRTTLHLHWNSWIIGQQADEEAAQRVGRGMIGRMEALRAAGINLMWTVHNVFPHDARFPDLEVELQNSIAESSNIIHLMSPGTIEDIEPYVNIDKRKVICSPHPSYLGAYPDVTSRAEARLVLGIDPDEYVFVMFGAIKAYKGLGRLLDAFHEATKRASEQGQRLRLVVAGGADQDEECREFIARARVHPQVLIETNKIPADKIQYFLRSADCGLVPYERMLNSGAALLYGTFDLPIVSSDRATIRGIFGDDIVEYMKTPDIEGLTAALLSATERFPSGSSPVDSIRRVMSSYDPDRVSLDFARQITEKVLQQ
ncbi:glycosyltransferase [Zhihengliuella salsuginis]|nr:glycosyltransferase [Zhihengliuella salsuginis]